MTRGTLRSKIVVTLLVVAVAIGWLVAPGAAHESESIKHNWTKHYRLLAKKIFYTKGRSNARFINVGETASNAALLDGLDSAAFAGTSHTHSGDDITSGTVAAARIDALIARDSEVFDIVLAADGTGSGLDADLLDGQSSGAFANASHNHSGDDITSGTVAAARIDALIARDAEVFDIVLAADGTGSGLDADLLDGLDSAAFAGTSHTHSGDDITSGTVAAARIDALLARDAEVFDIVTAADGTGSTLDADLLDGQSSGAFAAASHTHSGDDITSGTVAAARIDALLARDSEVFDIVLAADGTGSTLDADLLDGQSSGAFANASHNHSGDDITSGTVDETVIDVLIARVADVFDIVLAADGTGSTLDADFLDGLSSAAFASSSHVHSGGDITSGTVAEARIDALLARDSEVFGIVTAADGTGSGLDADLLDGMSSGTFEVDGLSNSIQWFKESADSLGTTATSERVVFTAPENITITDVFIEPAAALTASDTAYATIVISRRDATGGNKVTVASKTTQTAGSGGSGSWTAFSSVSLGTLTNTSVSEGKKLTIEFTKTGLGVALPVMIIQIEYTVD